MSELVGKVSLVQHPSVADIRANEELMSDVEKAAEFLIYTISLVNQLNIGIEEAVQSKLDKNEKRLDSETAQEVTERLERWQ